MFQSSSKRMRSWSAEGKVDNEGASPKLLVDDLRNIPLEHIQVMAGGSLTAASQAAQTEPGRFNSGSRQVTGLVRPSAAQQPGPNAAPAQQNARPSLPDSDRK